MTDRKNGALERATQRGALTRRGTGDLVSRGLADLQRLKRSEPAAIGREAFDDTLSPATKALLVENELLHLGLLNNRRLSANQRQVDAWFNVGVSYATGEGVPQDDVVAHMWMSLSIAQSSGEDRERRVKARDAVAARMTADQIAEAQRRAREWTPTPEP